MGRIPPATLRLDQYIEQQGQAIAPALLDENDVPHGCFLTRTEDYISREYNVHIHVIESARGHEWLTTKCVGRVIEGINGIQVFQLRSGIYHTFQDTHSAARCLITTNGYRLADIAAAYEAHLDAQF